MDMYEVHFQKKVKTLVSFFSTNFSTIWPYGTPSMPKKADGRTQIKHSIKFWHIGYRKTLWTIVFSEKYQCVEWPCSRNCRGQHFTLDLLNSKLAH